MTPPDDSSVLSQSAIDEMMAQDRGQAGPPPTQPPPAAAQAPPPAAPATPSAPAPAAAAAPGPDNAALADILQRLEKLEAAIAKVGPSQDANVQLETQARVGDLTNRIQALNTRVDELLHHLPNTVGYRARETFQCGSCGSQGLVAVPIMCTHCRQQTWLGWWPQT